MNGGLYRLVRGLIGRGLRLDASRMLGMSEVFSVSQVSGRVIRYNHSALASANPLAWSSRDRPQGSKSLIETRSRKSGDDSAVKVEGLRRLSDDFAGAHARRSESCTKSRAQCAANPAREDFYPPAKAQKLDKNSLRAYRRRTANK